jgi:hypothetical protein
MNSARGKSAAGFGLLKEKLRSFRNLCSAARLPRLRGINGGFPAYPFLKNRVNALSRAGIPFLPHIAETFEDV